MRSYKASSLPCPKRITARCIFTLKLIVNSLRILDCCTTFVYITAPITFFFSPEGYGIMTDGYTTYINASTCTVSFQPTNPPIIFDLPNPQGSWRPWTHLYPWVYKLPFFFFFRFNNNCLALFIYFQVLDLRSVWTGTKKTNHTFKKERKKLMLLKTSFNLSVSLVS